MIENFETKELDPHTEFDLLREDINHQLDHIFAEEIQEMEIRGDVEEIQEIKEKLQKREENFFLKVLLAVQKAVNSNPGKVMILFDIDETIGVSNFSSNGSVVTKLRPSLIPLLKQLKELDVEIGFLSSRSKEVMEEQLKDGQNLAPIGDYVDKELVFSSEQYDDSTDTEDELNKNFGSRNSIINNTLVQEKGGYEEFMTGEKQKIYALRDIRNQYLEKSIIVVDDFGYPRFLNEENGIYGVSLDREEEAFYAP